MNLHLQNFVNNGAGFYFVTGQAKNKNRIFSKRYNQFSLFKANSVYNDRNYLAV